MLRVIQKKKLSSKELINIIDLIKKENPYSIFANLRKKTLVKILNLILETENIILYVGKFRKKIVAYALFIKKLDLFFLKNIKFIFEIIFYIILKGNYNMLIVLILSFFKIDTIFLPLKTKKLIRESLNLHLLAVDKKFQNKGFGTFFLRTIFKYLKNYKFISLEAYDPRALYFYKKKFNFEEKGKKFRLTNSYKILIRKN